MTLMQLNLAEIEQLKVLNEAGKTAEVWWHLGGKGDAYALLGAAAVSGEADEVMILSTLFPVSLPMGLRS